MSVRVVHLVAKTHLDLGFTALASEVEQQYLEDFFPRAIAVAADLRARGGPERLVWTTGSWILHRALHQADGERAAAVDAAVQAGDLAWHALPLTTHTELMDAQLFRAGLGISQELDERFGRATTAAKMTDVPGHTRAMVPLLAEAGVTFLHLGVNPAWPVPDVPPVFRWRSPVPETDPPPTEVGVNSGPLPQDPHQLRSGGGEAEVVVAYAAGGYGGELVVPGCHEALAFLHSGDNLGPPTVDDVLAAHADLRARHPGAEVRASTLDAFARTLAASGAVDDLPVVTSEIGDPWLFGAASDPQKVGAYRWLLDAQRRFTELDGTPGPRLGPEEAAAFDRRLLLVAEHTWGLDQKIALPEDRAWGNEDLQRLRATPQGARFEASWAEQRAYLDFAEPLLWRTEDRGERAVPGVVATLAEIPDRFVRDWAVAGGTALPGVREVEDPAAPVDIGDWTVAFDPATAAVVRLEHRPTERVLADADHPLLLLTHQTFDEADYERFYAGLSPTPADEGWARWDNTKPGIDAGGARASRVHPAAVRVFDRSYPRAVAAELPERIGDPDVRGSLALMAEAVFPDRSTALGAPRTVWLKVARSPMDPAGLGLHVVWLDKPATRLPEATWCSFIPDVAEPDRWEIDKLGQRISPLDVVRRGGRALHGVGEGMHYDGPDGRLTIATHDAPLVAPGRPNLLDADPPVPDLAGGWHVLLHDNCWGTNFPMWNDGPASFRFTLSIA